MKVYARSISHGTLNYRKDTLLHFGDSHELIGSIILINPGSASIAQSRILDLEFISKFYKDNHNLPIPGNIEEWKEYNPDPTMGQVEKIFCGWYINVNHNGEYSNKRELNGVIQLFNLFDIRNPNLGAALAQQTLSNSLQGLFCEHAQLATKPVYLGWGHPGLNGFPSQTLNIFNNINLSVNTYLKPLLKDNRCYHPGYINRSYKHHQPTIELLNDFYLSLINSAEA